MNTKTSCNCFGPEDPRTESIENTYEEEEPSFEVVANIWRGKMTKSGLFLSSEIDVILPVWVDFVRRTLPHHPHASAEEFYISTAITCAQQLKHFSEDGWQCLLMQYAPNVLKCFENSLEEQEVKESSVSSRESLCDVHGQVEFLLQLVTSSNVALFLARKALHKSFTPCFNYAKSPHKLYMPRNHLDSNLEPLSQQQIRKNLIHGTYDGYILPLQIANEVNDEFWESECAEISAQSRFSKKE